MDSTTRPTVRHVVYESDAPPRRWRSWPLWDHVSWSWAIPLAILLFGGVVGYWGSSVLLAILVVVGITATLWQFFMPVTYEIDVLGLRRYALARTRLIPWHAVRAYRLRPTGIVLYQRGDPTKIDLLRSTFVPYPPDEDEALIAIRDHLPHAAELPN
jgi:hypothetical protein